MNKQPISEEELIELERLIAQLDEKKARAIERQSLIEGKWWYFAITGLNADCDSYDFSGLARLQRVEDPPGSIDLAGTLSNNHLFSSIGRHSPTFTYELAVNWDGRASSQWAFNLAWWLIAAIRVKTLVDLLIPAVADHSWSVIVGLPDRSCYAQLLEDVPQAKKYDNSRTLSVADLDWVHSKLLTFATLLETKQFRFAVEALTTHHLQESHRMTVAILWAGIEGLFGIQSELRYRLAITVASLLEPRGSTRSDLYKRVKKLYDIRSKAVHGSVIRDAQLVEHAVEVRILLSRLLCTIVELKVFPTEDKLDQLVLE